jgi:hypothetical protein
MHKALLDHVGYLRKIGFTVTGIKEEKQRYKSRNTGSVCWFVGSFVTSDSHGSYGRA